MTGEVALPLYAALGGAIILAIVFSFPPITTGSGSRATTAQYEADVAQELAYCREGLSGVDCKCFASKAVEILSNEKVKIPGLNYADPHDLARDQASQAC